MYHQLSDVSHTWRLDILGVLEHGREWGAAMAT